MSIKFLRLSFPPSADKQTMYSTMYSLNNTFGITINVISLGVTTTEGWMEVELIGSDAVISACVDWLRHTGVEFGIPQA